MKSFQFSLYKNTLIVDFYYEENKYWLNYEKEYELIMWANDNKTIISNDKKLLYTLNYFQEEFYNAKN